MYLVWNDPSIYWISTLPAGCGSFNSTIWRVYPLAIAKRPGGKTKKNSSVIMQAVPLEEGLPVSFRKLAAGVLIFAFSCAAASAFAQETLVVYWTKGFYPAEDKALDEMIDKFQKKTGVKVELSRYSPQESVPKAVAALDSGTPPDVAYGDVFDFQVAGKWAFEGRLEDLSDILVPMKASFLPVTLETVYMYNDKTKKRAYYAFPMKRQTMHIQYWKDLLAEAGDKEADIPKTWNR